jgi:hypothetical protein
MDWSALGYDFEFDSVRRLWLVRGTRQGLARFAETIRKEAPAPGTHVALGPHRDLLLIHREPRRIDEDGLHGTEADFSLLAELIEKKLARAEEGDTFIVDKQYAPGNRAQLEFELLEELS